MGYARTAIAVLAIVVLGGCASIISGRHAEIAFESYPQHAHVTIRDNSGRQVSSLTSPGVVTLKRNRKFFMPARYTATIEAPGYHPAQVPLRSTVNPWILGNVVFGGIPGLIVDAATGAAWGPRDSLIHQQLVPLDGPPRESYGMPGDAGVDEFDRVVAAHARHVTAAHSSSK